LGFLEPQDALEALERLPADMESAYTGILERIEKEKLDSTAMKVLSWLFCAQRPLHVDELREAMSIRPLRQTKLFSKLFIHPDSLVRSCQGLITVDEDTGIVRFTHHTVSEFLTKHTEKLLTIVDLAKICLTYLCLDVFEEGSCPDEQSFHYRIKSHHFASYAIQFWGHYTKGAAEEDSEVRIIFSKLLQSPQKRAAIRQIELVLQRGKWTADIGALSSLELSKWTSFHVLAQEGLLTSFNSLPRRNILTSVCQNGKTMLIDQGMNFNRSFGTVDSKDHDGSTPLHVAARHGHKLFVKTLLDRGANIGAQTAGGWTALHFSVQRGHVVTLLMLLERGADIEQRTRSGWTALHCASQFGHVNVLLALLKRQANVKAVTNGGWTALHCAAQSGHNNIAMVLSKTDIDVNAQDDVGWTALHRAIWSGHKDVVMTLLQKGAELKIRTSTQWTALHCGAVNGQIEVVQILLDQGSDVTAQDESKRTARDLAALNGHDDVVTLISGHINPLEAENSVIDSPLQEETHVWLKASALNSNGSECCFEEHPLDEMISCSNSSEPHIFCLSCAKMWARSQLDMGQYTTP
jgi:ankyrin repeat protein